jgi:hypothetical protein
LAGKGNFVEMGRRLCFVIAFLVVVLVLDFVKISRTRTSARTKI